MKKLSFVTTLLLICAAHAFAQDGAQTSAGARDLFNTYKSDNSSAAATAGKPGVRVRIELDRGGRVRWVSSKTTFRAGDRVRFHFNMNFSGYVVIINQGSSGTRSLLFPYVGVSRRVGRTVDYTVPQGEAWFEFDQTAGEERLTFIMSKREIQEAMQLTANGGAQPPAQSSGRPPQTEEQEILAALNSRALGGARDLRVAEDNNDGYVLATDDALAKPVGFMLTLKHR